MIVDILEVGLPTQSNKVYSLEILQENIERLRPTIEQRAFIGEFRPDVADSIVSFANASHVVTDLWIEDNTLKAKIDLMETLNGKMLHRFLDSCIDVQFSLVGVGNGQVNDQGHLIVDGSYKLTQVACYLMPNNKAKPVQRFPRFRSIADPWTISECP